MKSEPRRHLLTRLAPLCAVSAFAVTGAWVRFHISPTKKHELSSFQQAIYLCLILLEKREKKKWLVDKSVFDLGRFQA